MRQWPKPVSDSVNKRLAEYSSRELRGGVAGKVRQALASDVGRSHAAAKDIKPSGPKKAG
jgi:hypothetical protein